MNIVIQQNVALVRDSGILISDSQSALDMIAAVTYETGCTAMVLPKEAVAEDFWKLSTCLAGEVLQKFINYRMRLAVVGDFSVLSAASKSLHDFICESNKGKDIFFVGSETEALNCLSA